MPTVAQLEVEVDSDVAGALAGLGQVQAAIEAMEARNIRDLRLGADVDTQQAETQLRNLAREVEALDRKPVEVAVRAATESAEQKLARVDAKLKALREQVDAKLDLDTAQAQAQLSGIATALRQLDANVKVDADTSAARVEMVALLGQVEAVEAAARAADVRVRVEADTAAARAEVARLVAETDNLRGDLDIEVDTAAAKVQVRDLAQQISRLERDAVKVDVDTQPARLALVALEQRLDDLKREQRNRVRVEAETEGAAAKVAALVTAIETISSELDVDADISRAATQLRSLEGQINRLDTNLDLDVDTASARVALAMVQAQIDGIKRSTDAEVQVRAQTAAAEAKLVRIATAAERVEEALKDDLDFNMDTARAYTQLRALEQAIDKIKANVEVDVDQDSMVSAVAQVQALRLALNTIDHHIDVDVRVDTRNARAELEALWRRSVTASREISNIAGAVVGLTAAIMPVLGVLLGGIGAVGSAFAVAGVAGVGFGAMAVTAFSDVGQAMQKLKTYEDAYTYAVTDKQRADALARQKAVWASLTPEVAAMVRETRKFSAEWQQFAVQFQPGIFDIATVGMRGIIATLPQMTPMINGASAAFLLLTTQMFAAFQNPFWTQFFAWMGRVAQPVLVSWGNIIGNLGVAFAGLLQGFHPLTTGFLDGFEAMTARFAEWATNLDTNQSFQNFIAYVQENTPRVTGLIAALWNAFFDLGEGVAGMAGPMLGAITSIFEGISAFQNATPFLFSVTAFFLGLMGAMIAIVGPTKAFSSVLGLLYKGLATVIRVVVTRFAPALVIGAGPMGWIIGLLAAIVTGLIYAYTHFDGFADAVNRAGAAIVDGFGAGLEWLQDALRPALEAVTEFVGDEVDKMAAWWLTMQPTVEAAWDNIVAAVEAAVEFLTPIVEGKLTLLKSIWDNSWGTFVTSVTAIWDIIVALVSGGAEIMRGMLQTVLSLIAGDWDGAWEGMQISFDGFWSMIEGIGAGGRDLVVGIFNGMKDLVLDSVGIMVDNAVALFRDLDERLTGGAIEDTITGIVGWFAALPALVDAELQGWLDTLVSFFVNLPHHILDGLDDAATWLVNNGEDTVRGFLAGATAMLVDVNEWGLDLNNTILTAVGDAGMWLWEHGGDMITGLIDGAISEAIELNTWAAGLRDSILAAVGDAAMWLWENGDDMILGLIDAAEEKQADLDTYLEGIGKHVAITAGDGATWLYQQGYDMIVGFIERADEATDKLDAWLLALPGRIGGWFVDAGTWLYAEGERIVQGLLDGAEARALELGTWLSELPGRISTWLIAADEWIHNDGVDMVQGFIDGAEQKAFDIGVWAGELPARILAWIDDTSLILEEKGRDLMSGFIAGVESKAEDISTWLTDDLPLMVEENVTDAITWLTGDGEDTLQGFIDGMLNRVEELGRWLGEDLPLRIEKATVNAQKWLRDDGKEALQGFIDGAIARVKELARWLREDLPARIEENVANSDKWLKDNGTKIINGLISGMRIAIPLLVIFVAGIPLLIAGAFALIAYTMMMIGYGLTRGLITGISNSMPDLQTSLDNIRERFDQMKAEIIAQLIVWGVTFVMWVGTIFTNAKNAAIAKMVELRDDFVEWLAGLITSVITWGANLLTAFGEAVQGALDGGEDKLDQFLIDLGIWLDGLFKRISSFSLYDAGVSLLSSFGSGIADTVGYVTGIVDGAISAITDRLPGSPAKVGPLSGQGYALYRGQRFAADLAAGIASQQGLVASSAMGLAGALTGAVPDPRGMGLPLPRSGSATALAAPVDSRRGDGASLTDLEALVARLAEVVKPNVDLKVDMQDKTDPEEIANELTWALR